MNVDLTEDDFYNIYNLPFYTTIEVKLRSFKFKLSHFYYFTNKKLHEIGRKASPNCTFCEETEETILHLFVECPYIQGVWETAQNIISMLDPQLNRLQKLEKVLGMFKIIDNKKYSIINHVILQTQYHIHICRSKDMMPSHAGLMSAISDTEYLEKQIALKRGKLQAHEKKWQFLSQN